MSQKNRTINEQQEVQSLIQTHLETSESVLLYRQTHINFLNKVIEKLQQSKYYDSSIPWVIYWVLNPLTLLNQKITQREEIINLLMSCQNKGFAGSHQQMSHLAPTYAAVLSSIILECTHLIDIKGMLEWIRTLRIPGRGYSMHHEGEEDMRAIYIVQVIFSLFDIQEEQEGLVDYMTSCQTYEGGFAAAPGGEAHGGYSFCAYAALCLLDKTESIHRSRLWYWVSQRQMQIEGGFNGRTNKVVDACYTFWQGAIFQLLEKSTGQKIFPCHQELQMYVLLCAQDIKDGGLRDKPGKEPDFYHTCYTLAGLSLSQEKLIYLDIYENTIKRVDPIFNVEIELLKKSREQIQKSKNY